MKDRAEVLIVAGIVARNSNAICQSEPHFSVCESFALLRAIHLERRRELLSKSQETSEHTTI